MIRKLITIAAIAALAASCSEEEPLIKPVDPTPEVVDAPPVGNPSEYHQKMRTVPYPRLENELFVNPAPLIVPMGMKTKTYLQFELSQSAAFHPDSTELSLRYAWNMYNPHHKLEPGMWYWHFRNVDSDGNAEAWSETYSFRVSGSEPVFVTPEWKQFLEMAPQQDGPRMYCFLDAKLPAARRQAAEHPEYASLLQRAGSVLSTDYSTELDALYRSHDKLYQQIEYLYQAYHITRQEQYAAKLISLLKAMLNKPCPSSVLYSDNFITSTVTYAHAAVVDLLADRLDAATRRTAEDFVDNQCRRFYFSSRCYEENHIFDNHFWQINFRLMFQSALVIYDRNGYVYPRHLLQYLYELWTARAPASGFNRDGSWHNGTGYFTTNTKTLAVIPMLLSYVTRFNFTSHPWYDSAGQALAYSMPPAGANAGFGDGNEKNPEPNRQMAAFADFLARERGDAFATWYATSRPDLVHDDWEMRLYRMCNPDTYAGTIPDNVPLLTWYRDAGEVTMHSALTDPTSDLQIGFRSSQFGSGSHTTACQNAFNLVYAGQRIFGSAGYYQNFSDAHNLLQYRHTRGHNTILVNGMGQPYTTRAYGRILRAGSSDNIAYALGDASNAYCGYTDDQMWIDNFRAAGVEENAANGFGPTPLTRYHRHVAMLQPGITVIYDDLEASEAARWDWLLHSPVEFTINDGAGTIETSDATSGVKCRVTIMASSPMDMSQTSAWFCPPATTGPQYPDQWHFTATTTAPALRVLAIIQPCNTADDFSDVISDGKGGYTIDRWHISADMDPSSPAALHISNARTGSLLDVGTDPTLTVGSDTYYRGYTSSTMIIDGGEACELTDSEPVASRTL